MAGELDKMEKRLKEMEKTLDEIQKNDERQLSPEQMEKWVKATILKEEAGAKYNLQWEQTWKEAEKSIEARLQRIEARLTQVANQVEDSRKGAANMADVKNVLLKLIEVDKRVKALEGN